MDACVGEEQAVVFSNRINDNGISLQEVEM